MTAMGSAAHQALVKQVTAHYAGDPRVRAVAVFGSVGSGTWHELSDVDLDIVTADGVVIDPGAEARALFGVRAAIVAGQALSGTGVKRTRVLAGGPSTGSCRRPGSAPIRGARSTCPCSAA